MSSSSETDNFSQNKFAQNILITKANETSPLLAGLLGSLFEQGMIYASGVNFNEDFLQQYPIVTPLPQEDFSSKILTFTTSDFYFIQTDSIEKLFEVSGQTAAQIVLVSDFYNLPSQLYDYQITPSELPFFFSELSGFSASKNSPQKISTKKIERPAVFLDRDGVVIKHIDYISNPKDVHLTSGISDFIKKARATGYSICVVTNQSGIGREYFSHADYELVNQRMLELLSEDEALIDKVLFSPYFEKSKLADCLINKNLRKPRAGMLLNLAQELNLNLKDSIIVGDRATDLMAGVLAKLSAVYLLESKKTAQELYRFNNWVESLTLPIKTGVSSIKSFAEIQLK